MYGLVVRFEVRLGHEAAFDDLVEELLQAISAAEPRTAGYIVHRVEGTPGSRVFYELYENQAAFDAHEAAPYVRRFLDQRRAHLQSEPEVWPVVPGPGLLRPEAIQALLNPG